MLFVKPCKKCGAQERYSDGECAPCARVQRRRYQQAHPEQQRLSNRNCARRRRGWVPGEHEKAEAALPYVTSCDICGSLDPRHNSGAWQADHDARTGLFRAFLCYPCNTILGFVEKYDVPVGSQYTDYLERHRLSRAI